MVKKIIQIGSSLGITLSSDQLKKLGVSKGSDVEIKYNSKRDTLEVTAVVNTPENMDENFLRQINSIVNEHKQDLARLQDDA